MYSTCFEKHLYGVIFLLFRPKYEKALVRGGFLLFRPKYEKVPETLMKILILIFRWDFYVIWNWKPPWFTPNIPEARLYEASQRDSAPSVSSRLSPGDKGNSLVAAWRETPWEIEAYEKQSERNYNPAANNSGTCALGWREYSRIKS